MSNDFKKFLYAELRDHLHMIGNKVDEEDYDNIEYHLSKADQLLDRIKEMDPQPYKFDKLGAV